MLGNLALLQILSAAVAASATPCLLLRPMARTQLHFPIAVVCLWRPFVITTRKDLSITSITSKQRFWSYCGDILMYRLYSFPILGYLKEAKMSWVIGGGPRSPL